MLFENSNKQFPFHTPSNIPWHPSLYIWHPSTSFLMFPNTLRILVHFSVPNIPNDVPTTFVIPQHTLKENKCCLPCHHLVFSSVLPSSFIVLYHNSHPLSSSIHTYQLSRIVSCDPWHFSSIDQAKLRYY
jgi:hypothetical protein